MAEELDPALAGTDDTTVVQDVDEQKQEPTLEEIARDLGWRPKEEFRGDPEEWRPPADYIREGGKIQRSMSKELGRVREEVSRIGRTSAELTERIVADKIAERDAYWAERQAKAVEDGDQAGVNKAVAERLKLRGELPAKSGPAAPSETQEFIARHSKWYGKDPLATERAHEVAERLAKSGYDVATQLAEAERAVRKEFPEHFPKAKDPPGTQTGGSRAAGGGSKPKGFSDMPAASQEMAKDYLKRHGLPLEKFAESYWADQGKRRVA